MQDLSQDEHIREVTDFHMNTNPTFMGIIFRENLGKNSKRAPENTP